MNILLVTPWDEELGGVASVVTNLAKYLQKQSHHVRLFHPSTSTLAQRVVTQCGFQGYHLNLRAPFSRDHPVRAPIAFLVFFPMTMYQLIRVIYAESIEIVNIHYPIVPFIYFAVCSWVLPVKLVISVHGADCFPEGHRMKRYPWALRVLLWSSHALIAPSRAFLADCLSAFPHITRRARFIHNGVDLQELSRPPGFEQVAKENRYLLCIAACNEKKALDVLIKAFALVKGANPTHRLILVGDGPLRHEFEQLAKTLAVQDRVEFVGAKARDEIARLLHDCEIFVLPSRSEPFGLVILEAMACRRPVVATSVGGIPEIIDNGKTGILVEPDNPRALAVALLTLLSDHSLQDRLAGNGYTRVVARFQYRYNGASYERLFSDLLNGRSPERWRCAAHRAPDGSDRPKL